MRHRLLFLASMVIVCNIMLTGCAVHMAANAPSQKNLNVLEKGTPRELVHAELGSPIITQENAGNKVEVFKFAKGYSSGEKLFHAVGHGAADFFTLGLWEAVGTPSESLAQDNELAVKVQYDLDNNVEEVIYLKSGK